MPSVLHLTGALVVGLLAMVAGILSNMPLVVVLGALMWLSVLGFACYLMRE